MKIAYKIIHFLILLICLILQIVFIEYLKLYHINIDLVMVAILGISIFDGVLYGIAYGFAAGLLLDLMVSNVVGVNALIYALDAFIVSKVINMGFRFKIITYVIIVFFITELNLLVVSGVYYLFNFSTSLRQLGLEMLINPVGNILFMFLIFPALQAGREKKDEFGFLYKDKI
jgi:rod shape-determining protein MreD